MDDIPPTSSAAHKRAVAERTANGVFKTRESRAQQAKNELAAASAATDTKTARLRALRQEKERQDADAAALAAAAPVIGKKKPARQQRGA